MSIKFIAPHAFQVWVAAQATLFCKISSTHRQQTVWMAWPREVCALATPPRPAIRHLPHTILTLRLSQRSISRVGQTWRAVGWVAWA